MSDSKWDTTSAVKKSQSSFKRYYISDMSYNEGLIEVVDKLKLFVKYDIVYENIGRHIGSYSYLLTNMQLQNDTMEKVLEEMNWFIYVHLCSCIRQSGNITSTFEALEMLNRTVVTLTGEHTYDYTIDKIKIFNYLLDCNVLFRNKCDELAPQNQLMRNAIIKVLATRKFFA